MSDMPELTKKNLGISLKLTEASSVSAVEMIPHTAGQLIISDSAEMFYDSSSSVRICLNSSQLDSQKVVNDIGALVYDAASIEEVNDELQRYTKPGIYRYSYCIDSVNSTTEIMIVTLVSQNDESIQVKQLINRADGWYERFITIREGVVTSSTMNSAGAAAVYIKRV